MESTPPKISVVIPSWNAQDWIKQTIESVLIQTWKNVEIVVVDDGSADQTVSILKSFGSRISLVIQENAGNSAARNRGLHLTTGDYVAFLDNDDIWMPSKLEDQIQLAGHATAIGLVFCDYESFGGDTAPNGFARGPILSGLQSVQIGSSGYLITDPEAPERLLDDLFCQIPSTWLFRRACLVELGGFEPQLRNGAEDLHLAYRLALRYRLAYSNKVLVQRRERANSLGRSSNLAVSYVRALSLLANDETLSKGHRRALAARAASTSHHLMSTVAASAELSRLLRSIAWTNAPNLPLAQAARIRLRAAVGELMSRIGS